MNQPSPVLPMTKQDSALKAAGADHGTPDLADYHDFTSRMTQNSHKTRPTLMTTLLKFHKAPSIDYNAPPGRNKAIPRTRSSRHGHGTESMVG
jgi:hypothetical protein